MAETQEYEMGNGEVHQGNECQDDQMNGGDNSAENGGEAGGNSGNESAGKDDDRKLFVGGLSWETSDKELRDHFGSFGEIDSINVKTDPSTGRSRGFAFIVFKAADSIDKVLASGDHVINNKKIDPKKAKARQGKIFVGGLSPELTDADIRSFFAQFGTIAELEMPFDKTKNKRKGFCFITYETEEVVTALLKTPKQSIKGHEVDIKKATPKIEGGGAVRGRGRGGVRGRGRGGFVQGGYGQGGYSSYAAGYTGGYGDYYGSGYGSYGAGYGGYDSTAYGYGYDGYGYGSGYEATYPPAVPARGARGKSSGGYGGGKQRGGGRGQRHVPY